jgi:molecular chaperone GrpE
MNDERDDSIGSDAAVTDAPADRPDPASKADASLELRREKDALQDRLLRTAAEFDNYRKRVEREREAAERSGKRAIILSLLDMMDDFERALEHVDQSPDAVVEGLRAIHKRLADTLKAQGITPIESVGRQFDPMMHEAVGAIEAGAKEAGIALEPGAVTDETRRGYLWDGDVLRPARVLVAK